MAKKVVPPTPPSKGKGKAAKGMPPPFVKGGGKAVGKPVPPVKGNDGDADDKKPFLPKKKGAK